MHAGRQKIVIPSILANPRFMTISMGDSMQYAIWGEDFIMRRSEHKARFPNRISHSIHLLTTLLFSTHLPD